MAIILISSDCPKVLALTDRTLAMREGRQRAILNHREATQERVLSAAMGQPTQPIDLLPEGDGINRAAAAEAIATIDQLVAGGDRPLRGHPADGGRP